MANFSTHISVAFIASSTAALIFYKAGMLHTSEFLLCSVVGTLGGLLPDIDLDHAVPAKVGFNIVAMLMGFASVAYAVRSMSVLELIIIGCVVYAVVRWGVFGLFNQLAHHRGIVHSVPYMSILAVGMTMLVYYGLDWSASISWFIGLFLLFGTLVHLLLDEMFSVNVFGLKLKKSFGTAFKFFSIAQWHWYVALYLILGIMLWLAPPFQVFWHTITDPISWLILKKSLLPHGLSSF